MHNKDLLILILLIILTPVTNDLFAYLYMILAYILTFTVLTQYMPTLKKAYARKPVRL